MLKTTRPRWQNGAKPISNYKNVTKTKHGRHYALTKNRWGANWNTTWTNSAMGGMGKRELQYRPPRSGVAYHAHLWPQMGIRGNQVRGNGAKTNTRKIREWSELQNCYADKRMSEKDKRNHTRDMKFITLRALKNKDLGTGGIPGKHIKRW